MNFLEKENTVLINVDKEGGFHSSKCYEHTSKTRVLSATVISLSSEAKRTSADSGVENCDGHSDRSPILLIDNCPYFSLVIKIVGTVLFGYE